MAQASCPQARTTYFANEDASVQDIKESARAAGFTGSTPRGHLLAYMTFKTRVESVVLKAVSDALVGDKGRKASDSIGTLHVAHFVGFEKNHIGFFTIYDGSVEKYFQDFAEKTSFMFDTLFPHIEGAPPTPVAKNAEAFLQWGWRTPCRPSGSTARIQASRSRTFEPCWPTIGAHQWRPLDRTASGGRRSWAVRSGIRR